MKISLNWVGEYIDLSDQSPEDVEAFLTEKAAEVEGIELSGVHLEKIFVAEIKKLKPHPEADKLQLATVTVDGKEEMEVVCGATNIFEGMRVPYAGVGAGVAGHGSCSPDNRARLGVADLASTVLEPLIRALP